MDLMVCDNGRNGMKPEQRTPEFSETMKKWNQEDFEGAYHLMKKSALSGHVASITKLMRWQRDDNFKDLIAKDKYNWTEMLIDLTKKNNPHAQWSLSNLYRWGGFRGKLWECSEEEMIEANRLLVEAAMQGHPEAEFYLGEVLEFGLFGFEENMEEAMKWYKKALAQGDPDAMLRIGSELLKTDREAGIKLLKQASEMDNGMGHATEIMQAIERGEI